MRLAPLVLPIEDPSFSKRPWNLLSLPSVLLVLMSLAWASPALAQEALTRRTLTVTGRGVENVQTTKAEVRLGVEAQGKTASEVQQAVARRSSAVVNLLRSRNVERLETTGISLSPNYNYDNGKQQLVGYIGSNIVSFRVGTEQAGVLLDEAVKAGATRIDGISFIAVDEAINQARQQALREATQDALTQAGTVLKSLNLTQREIVSIQVSGATVSPPPVPLQRQALSAADSALTPVIGGEQEIETSVTLQVSY